jgi:serine phosphatase RsbU (regulator of sigma subunit)
MHRNRGVHIWESGGGVGELFGDDRLAQVLVERRGDSASEMLKHLIDAVLEFGGEPRDDIAALVLKVPA